MLASAWKSSGLILGMPTYEFKGIPSERDLELVRERSAELARLVKTLAHARSA
jgi:hypothetical protein